MIKNLIYNYYYKKFMKENSKPEAEINWGYWEALDNKCEKFR